MEKQAHFVVLAEIERHLENNRQIENATESGSVPAFEIVTRVGATMEMGGACGLLDLLPLISIPLEDIPTVLEKLNYLLRKYRHALIVSVIGKLTPVTIK